jgi:chromatin remodeling complex protein RSC6
MVKAAAPATIKASPSKAAAKPVKVTKAGKVVKKKEKTKKEKKAERKEKREALIAAGQIPKTSGGLHKMMRLSPALAGLLGCQEASRSQVNEQGGSRIFYSQIPFSCKKHIIDVWYLTIYHQILL